MIEFEVEEHNVEDCIKLINYIICELPLIKTIEDKCLLERLLNLILIIDSSFHTNHNNCHFVDFESDDERQRLIREWLFNYYKSIAKYFIENLNFNESEDRTKVAILIINILFKLKHSLKDIEQYLQDFDTFVQFDEQLNDITRFDRLLEIVQKDLNEWKSDARYYEVKCDEMENQIDKYEQNEAFNSLNNKFSNGLKDNNIMINKPIEQTLAKDKKALNVGNRVTPESQISKSSDISLNGLKVKNDDKDVPKIDTNENISILCAICNKYFATNNEYDSHLANDRTNIHNKHLNHRNESNNNLLYKCTYNGCRKLFFGWNQLKQHFFWHKTNPILFVCDYIHCSQKYSSLSHLRSHQNLMNHKNKSVVNNGNRNEK